MYEKVGQLQKKYLECLGDMNEVFREMRGFFEENDIDLLFEYRNILMEFGKALPNILSAFGHEQKIEESRGAVKVYEFCRTKEEMLDRRELCVKALADLADLVDMLLNRVSGKLKTCNCCGEQVYYKPLPVYYELQEKKYKTKPGIPETLSREEYTCPVCYSSDRDRLMVAFLKKLELDKLIHAEKLLQIAPSSAIEHWIYANCPALIYNSTDLYMRNVSFSSDVQDMSMIENESYDYFICSHVLEHVKDDRRAMKELYRILKNDGMGLFLVPVLLDREHIDEEWGLTEEENWRRFGQGDHCRCYAKQKMTDRLEEAGFTVHSLDKDFFGEEEFKECGLTDTSTLYVLTKRQADISDLILEKKMRRDLEWEKPLVSVILPCYNHEKYVAKAIESVLGQSYQSYEFLVGDDGSSDGTAEEILKYEDRIDQVHLFEVNTGCRAGKFMLGESKGKYVALMHSDDLWAPDKLEMQVLYLENHPECAACFTGCTTFNDEGEDLGSGSFLTANKKKEEWFRILYESENCFCNPSILIRRDIYMRLVYESAWERYRQLPDYWMWLNLVQESEVHVIEKSLTFFRWHTNEDNINTSAPTQENIFRHMVERNYIRYEVIKNMDAAYFSKAFKDCIKKKDFLSEKEIMCEKFFVLLNTNTNYDKQAAIHYLYEICAVEGVLELLENQYNFGVCDIYKITGEYLPETIKSILR